jgi:hypothetical protein
MLKVTCFKCHWNWQYSNEAIKAMLDEVAEGQSSYPVECPRCRRINKVSVKKMKSALPRVPESHHDDSTQAD